MEHISLGEVDSTNDRALDLYRRRPRRLAVTARTQTAGVGRSGRRWLSPAGGLWMTMAWPMAPEKSYAALPLIVGLAVREAIAAECGVEAQIKWPNDLLIGHRKVAGILCRAEVDDAPVLLIGVGINANFPVGHLDADLRQPATTLRDETAREIDVGRLGQAVAGRMERGIEALEREGVESSLAAVRRHLAWMGQAVTCTGISGEITAAGIFRGIDDDGAALIESGGQHRAMAIGELHFSQTDPT